MKAELLNLSVGSESAISECNDSSVQVGATAISKHWEEYRILKKRADRYWNNPNFEKL